MKHFQFLKPSLLSSLFSDSSKGHSHSHSHPTVTHSAVGPMYAMGAPIPPHHHQGSEGVPEKKKKKEEKDRDKHDKDKEKVRYCEVILHLTSLTVVLCCVSLTI